MTVFEDAFIQCLKDGVYPGPSNINERKPNGYRFNRLNGKDTRRRIEMMYDFAVPYLRGVPIEWSANGYAPTKYNSNTVPVPWHDRYYMGANPVRYADHYEMGARKHEILHPDKPWELKSK